MFLSTSGPVAAFFDLDETLIACKSMFDFLVFLEDKIPQIHSEGVFSEIESFRAKGVSRQELNQRFWRLAFTGVEREAVQHASELWFRQKKEAVSGFFIPSALERFEWHRSACHEIVMISGSAGEIVSPIARELHVEHVFSTELAVEEGLFTGEVVGSVMIGRRKAEIAMEFALRKGADIKRCFAYGDHISDIPLLETVGFAFVVGNDLELGLIAGERNWPRLGAMITWE